MIKIIYIAAGLLLVAQVSALARVWHEVKTIEKRKEKEWNE